MHINLKLLQLSALATIFTRKGNTLQTSLLSNLRNSNIYF